MDTKNGQSVIIFASKSEQSHSTDPKSSFTHGSIQGIAFQVQDDIEISSSVPVKRYSKNILRILFALSSRGTVEFFINDKLEYSQTFELEEIYDDEGIETLQVCEIDVTKYAEQFDQLTIELSVKFDSETDNFIFFPTESEKKSTIRYVENQSYQIQSILWSVFSWGLIQAIGVLIVANISLSQDSKLVYVFGVVTAWMVSISGLPDIANIPIKKYLRVLYSWSYDFRKIFLSIVSVIFLISIVFETHFIFTLYLKHKYETLLTEYLSTNEEEYIIEAFELLPWRKEAQILIALHGDFLRRSPTFKEKHHSFYQGFFERYELSDLIAFRENRFCKWVLDSGDKEVLRDPFIWLASILPNASSSDVEIDCQYYDLALNLLERLEEKSFETEIIKISYDISTIFCETEQFWSTVVKDRYIQKLDSIVNQDEQGKFRSHFSLEAIDFLAKFECLNNPSADSTASCSTMFNEFAKMIRARELSLERVSQAHMPVWNRPPDKLFFTSIYFQLSDNKNSSYFNLLKHDDVFLYLNYCGCEEDFVKEFIVNPDYVHLKQIDWWLKGTIFELADNGVLKWRNIDNLSKHFLSKGWKY